jgi:hypothetical protein
MSYRAGIGPGLGRLFGDGPSAPTISCDGEGCRAAIVIDGNPPGWFLGRRPKPGWSLSRTERDDGSIKRIDLCPEHRAPRKGRRK